MFASESPCVTVSVIDVPAMKVVKVVPVGEVPKRINTLVMN